LPSQVTIGHGALITSSTIGNRVLIGQGAVVQEGSEIGNNSIIAAGAVVLPGTCTEFRPAQPCISSPLCFSQCGEKCDVRKQYSLCSRWDC
jgi:carbonic anhydrase/acetyltransferase-like protein (isoleucine patch superfamily)